METITDRVICPSAQAAGGQDENEVAVVAPVTTTISTFEGSAARKRLRTSIALIDDFTTRTTGKALPGQKPFWNLSGPQQWLLSLLLLFAHIAGLLFLITSLAELGLWDLILVPIGLVGLISLTGRFRVQVVTFGHHFIHRAGARAWPIFDRWAAHLALALTLGPNPTDYEEEHVTLHHSRKWFTTPADPDAALVLRLGFRPGMSRRALYRQMWRSFFSPRCHAIFAYGRIKSALITSSWTHRAVVLTWLALLGLIATMVPWWAFVTVIVLPLGPLYHVSSLLQLLTEHQWMITASGPVDRQDYARRCIGRFCLAAPPPPGRGTLCSAGAWCMWSLKMIPLMLIRLGAWVGDLPAHDWHHDVAMIGHDARAWPQALFERERAIQQGDMYGLATREAYNPRDALNWVFDGFAAAKE